MPVSSDIEIGNLTTSPAILRTGANDSENLKITFRNSGVTSRTVTVFLEGSTDPDNVIQTLTLPAGWSIVGKGTLGNGNTIQAAQDSGTDVFYFIEEVLLT